MLSRIQNVARFGMKCAAYPITVALTPFEDSIRAWGARETKRALNDYGLKYHDIVMESPDVVSAMKRLTPEEKQNMDRRLTRAFDISLNRNHYLNIFKMEILL